MKVVVINGSPQSGKDTFVDFFSSIYPLVENISTVDFIKDFLYNYGWDGRKTPEARKAIADIKQALINFDDMAFEIVADQIEEQRDKDFYYDDFKCEVVVFVHCREPEEIIKYVEAFDAVTVYVDRPQASAPASNSADANVQNYEYDYVILNDSTFQAFTDKVYEFKKVLIGR